MEYLELYILNTEFSTVCMVDNYESMIWTDRYKAFGDFELYLSAESDILVYAVHGYYLWSKNTDRLMIIEKTEIITNSEQGNHLRITGRSLESILDRRIIWHQVTVSGKVYPIIKKFITEQIISPSLSDRAISNFVFVENNDERFDDFEIEEAQYLGDNLYSVISDLCSLFNIGFKVVYNYTTGNFEFSLYLGTDRSYDQSLNPYVVFSPEFDNIISSNFIEDSETYRNATLVAGEDPGTQGGIRKFVYVTDSSEYTTGLTRRELFTDGSSKQQKYTDENDQEITLTDAQYISVLKELGLSELSKKENKRQKAFEGEMSTNREFFYGVDFDLGDIVQIENEYGLGAACLVNEVIMSQDENGVQIYPTFESIAVD